MGVPGYELGDQLSEGPSCKVYKAVQQSTRQNVAVKIFKDFTPASLASLGRALRLGSHPALVGTVDAQLRQDPAFLVTYWMPESLQSWRQKSASHADLVEGSARWLKQTAQGLSYIHRRGLLHGNLRPQNLFLDEQDSLRIGDFGLPGSMKRSEEVDAMLFQPPEFLQRATPEPGWDLYALGSIFYLLLSGTHPRMRSSTLSRLAGLPAPLRRREYWIRLRRSRLVPLQHLNPNVDTRLCMILERCLSLDPRQRYREASELLEDLALRSQSPLHPVDALAYACRRLF